MGKKADWQLNNSDQQTKCVLFEQFQLVFKMGHNQ